MCDRNGGRRLRQWLIEQIDSNMYPGLIWENDEKSMFRIPWKHAGKQDYNQEVDASIFKAWAVFKGKFKEGDKAEPATWKTRLRCALNKSPDFEEVTDRSQLDISEPYKVYRIVPEEEQKCKLGMATPGCVSEITEMECGRSEIDELIKEPSVDDYMGVVKRSPSPPEACRNQLLPDWWAQQPSAGLPLVTGYAAYDAHHSAFSQMVISFYYGGKLVGQTTTSCPEGCRLSLGQPGPPGAKLYGPEGLELVRFPPADAIPSERQRQVTRKLFGHLERGVLLHSSRQGVLVKRLCQGRVFCSGNAVLCKDRPNKLERDEVVKVFDTSQFFRGLSLEPEERGARGACVGGWQFRSCSVLSRPATLGHLCVERGCGHSSFPEWLWGVLRTPAPPSGTVRRSWQPVRNAEARAPPPPAGRDPRFGKVPGDQGAHSETG
uniref:Interferon regulatory factor 8 n=2 Tax=Ailuropoda melanoleuca TaxID=9646 RepID=A0A7N5K4B4_AILME